MFVRSTAKNSNDENPLEAMFALLVRAVADELAQRGAPSIYSTEPGMWPPGTRSARSAKRRIVQVPEHERVGAGVYRCERDAYHAHYARRRRDPIPTPQRQTSDTDLAARALELAGLRPIKEVA